MMPFEKKGVAVTHALATCPDMTAVPFGEPIEVVDDLYAVRVPLPHNPLKAINSYFVLDGERTTIIDVGFNHPACKQALDDALAALGREWDGVQLVFTHSHPDHTGNLDRIYQPGMELYGNIHSFQEVKNLLTQQEQVFTYYLEQAASPTQRAAAVAAADGAADGTTSGGLHVSAELLPVASMPQVQYLQDGDELRLGRFTFEVVETPGHDPWHICLYERTQRIMIVGDHVLERITPSVAAWLPTCDALAEFLASLQKVAGYEADLVLPAHGAPFSGLQERVAYLTAHHEARLEEIYGLVATGHAGLIDISSHAQWRYPDWASWALDQKFFSMGETMAHLIHLVSEGKLQQTICGKEFRFEVA